MNFDVCINDRKTAEDMILSNSSRINLLEMVCRILMYGDEKDDLTMAYRSARRLYDHDKAVAFLRSCGK